MKKIITLLLLSIVAMAGFAQTAFEYPAGNVTYYVHCNDATMTGGIKLKSGTPASGEITIPSQCANPADPSKVYTITSVLYQGFMGRAMTKVTLPSTLKTIETEAFRECADLTQVVFNDGLESIKLQAFFKCYKLGDLRLPSSLTEMASGAFYNCKSIHSVNFADLTLLKTIGARAFSLSEVPGYNQSTDGLHGDLIFAEGLEKIEDEVFARHLNVNGRLVLPSTLKHFGNVVFQGNGTFPNFTGTLSLPDGLEYIGSYAFCRWPQQAPIKLPSKLKYMGAYAFFRSLVFDKNFVIPASVEVIGLRSLYFCSTINNITVEEGSNLKAIYDRAFLNPYLNFVDLRNAPITDFTKYTDQDGTEQVYANTPFGRDNNSDIKSGFMNGLNPYTLVYLPSGMTDPGKVPADAVNVIQTTADGSFACKNFVAHDEFQNGWASYPDWDYHYDPKLGEKIPYEVRGCDYGKAIIEDFTAARAKYVRTFSSGRIASVMLPYDATVPAGMKAYKLQCKNESGQFYFLSIDDSRLTDIAAEDRNKLKAYTPYLLRVVNAGSATLDEDFNVLVAKARDIEDIKAANTTKDNFSFVGSVDNIYHDAAKNMRAYTMKNNVWYPVKDNPSLQPGEVDGFVHSFRAFVIPPAGTSGGKFAMLIEDDETTTDIQDIQTGLDNEATDIYTIDGRYVGRKLDALPAGLYVVGGKKLYKF
ncbi:MAG: leucine-rich repeat domain-containing protein [Prevotellaceae bacterium]|nr:leucine-rich repeat domain-containing protein [Prevotellaceae bacterium]